MNNKLFSCASLYLVKCFYNESADSGNPAAICINFSGADSERQNLAKTLNLPVTVFISQDKENYSIRFFYPDTEMPLCIHGALAAAKVVMESTAKKQILFQCRDDNSIEVVRLDNNCFQTELSEKKLSVSTIDKKEIADILNISDKVFHSTLPFCVRSVGSPKLLVPLKSLESLLELKPKFDLIKKWSISNTINGLYVYTPETVSENNDIHARGFNPTTGNDEDSATGVAGAALCLALKKSIKIERIYSADATGLIVPDCVPVPACVFS